jgi:aromatic-L-amino-acid decarboxylase
MRNPMFVYDDQLTDLVFDLCRERLSLDPVPLDFGGTRGELKDTLAGLLNPEGTDPETVLELFSEHLAKAVISCDSPRFLSFIPAAPTKAALLFDMVVSCSSLQGTSWLEAAGAVAAENQVLRLLADLAGLPPGAGGCFVSGGSIANLSALIVARDTAAIRQGRAAVGTPLVAVSEEAHSSVGKALHIIGVGTLLVPTEDHRLTGAALASVLETDPRADDVFAVVATAGTTNAGIVDDLAGIGAIARERSLWFHVDGAYGGAALFAPSARWRYQGLELADSFIVDPHKWLFAPFDCAALLYRQPRLAKAVHAQSASYLDVLHGHHGDDGEEEEYNPSDYAIHLTRRARGLPLWFSLAVNGTDAYRDAVEAVLAIARDSAGLIAGRPYLHLLREPELSVVLFERIGWTRADYDNWSADLLAAQQGFVTATTWQGRPAARLAFLHPDTTVAIVTEILDTMA